MAGSNSTDVLAPFSCTKVAWGATAAEVELAPTGFVGEALFEDDEQAAKTNARTAITES